MQEIPAIIENSIAPFSPSFIAAPIKIPTIPAMIIMISDTTVLNFFIFTPPVNSQYAYNKTDS